MKNSPASEYALMGTLMNGPVHGYEIMRSLKSDLGSTWRVPTSQLYALLKKLEDRGLVRSKLEHQNDRPSKRVFQLTDLGVEAFEKWLHTPCDHVRDLRIEFLAKMYFVRSLHKDGTGLVEAQTKVLEQAASRIRSVIAQERDPYGRLIFEVKLATTTAWLNWLKENAQPFVEAIEP